MIAKVTQLRPYLDLEEWLGVTGELLEVASFDLPDGEVSWLLAIFHLSHMTRATQQAKDINRQQWIGLLHRFLRGTQEAICVAAIVGKLTVQERLLMEHLSIGVAIAQKLYPAMDWCSEIEEEEFGREGN